MIWLEFAAVSGVVVIFGYHLSFKADMLADAKGLGKGLVGFILLGFTTSVPELISTVTSTVFLDNPSMGAGNIIGSNNANLVILFASLLFSLNLRRKDSSLDEESLVSVAFCFAVTTVFLTGILNSGSPFLAGKSFFSYILVLLFFISIYELNKSSRNNPGNSKKKNEPLGGFFYIKLLFSLAVLVVSSYYLTNVVDRISRITPLEASASGAIFLAWSTSLPELAVTVSSIIIGSSEMGIGNILGSNIFNMMVLSIAELLSRSRNSVFYNDRGIEGFSMIQLAGLSLLLIILLQRKLVSIGRVSILSLFFLFLYFYGMIILA